MKHNSAGFTLMEVVVAISLMSLVVAILFLGLRLAANGVRRGEQKLEEHSRVMAGNEVMERQVSQALPWKGTIQQGLERKTVDVVGFNASPDEMRFVTRASWRGDRTLPHYLAEYRIVRRDGQQQLVAAEAGLTDDASLIAALMSTGDEPASMTPVDDPADAIDFAFYREETSQQPAGWVDRWQATAEQELPRALRVRWIRGNHADVQTFLIAIHREPKVRP